MKKAQDGRLKKYLTFEFFTYRILKQLVILYLSQVLLLVLVGLFLGGFGFVLGSCLFGWFWLAVFFLCDKVFSGYNLIMVLVKKKPVLHSYLRIFSQNHHQHHIKYLLRCGLFREGGAFTKLLPLIYQLIIESSTLTFKRGQTVDG